MAAKIAYPAAEAFRQISARKEKTRMDEPTYVKVGVTWPPALQAMVNELHVEIWQSRFPSILGGRRKCPFVIRVAAGSDTFLCLVHDAGRALTEVERDRMHDFVYYDLAGWPRPQPPDFNRIMEKWLRRL